MSTDLKDGFGRVKANENVDDVETIVSYALMKDASNQSADRLKSIKEKFSFKEIH